MALFFMDAGKAITTNLVSALGGTVPKYTAMGTGAGPANSAATALTTEVETRATGTITRVTTTVTNDAIQVVGTQTATATRVITEAGLFDQSALGGNMMLGANSGSVGPFTLASGDSLQETWKLTYS